MLEVKRCVNYLLKYMIKTKDGEGGFMAKEKPGKRGKKNGSVEWRV